MTNLDEDDPVASSVPITTSDGKPVCEVQLTRAGIIKLSTQKDGHRGIVASIADNDFDFEMYNSATGQLVLTLRLSGVAMDIVMRNQRGEAAIVVHTDRETGVTITRRDEEGDEQTLVL